ncbi:long-chain fatty acid--CoA ligase [Halostella sp. PRR32]|uniref:AMP-dependent synthetase/ligase n=1 Tax=Halostella sp. PRR32 TaxID=3098147 RepID=UPI002B1E6FA7|nr:long-chain fatty acid--CoA ligase [Halostella sp. PRR32]
MTWREAESEYTDDVIEMTTLPRMFEDSAARNEHRPAQQYKGGVYDRSLAGTVVQAAPDGEYRALSYADVRDIVRSLAAGFRDLGIGDGDRVGLYASTRMEWAQCDFALLAAGGVVTTVYRGSSESQAHYLLDDPDATAVVVEGRNELDTVLAVEDDLDLNCIVTMDAVESDRDDVYSLATVHERGAEQYDPDEYEQWLSDRSVDDLASLIYTSGTTGRPKGVKLTHRNFRSNVNQIRKRLALRPDRDGDLTIDEETRTVSFLPLAHVFERTAGHFVMFACGACVAYAESSDTIQEDFQAVRPTSATSVPRVYEKIYDAIREQASESGLKQRIFEWATDVGRAYHEADSPGLSLRAKQAVAEKLVFDQVTDALGGEIELLISGGGSLSADLCALYHGMGLPIYEGYGLTETSPVVSVNPPDEPKVGTIGPPVADVDVYLDDSVLPPGEFEDADGEVGELLVRGPNVTDGYWNRPGETEAAFSRLPGDSNAGNAEDDEDADDRWFRTGDIVRQRPDDYIVFEERLKQLLVLSTGKNVAPGPIEDAFASSEVVEQCMVVGDGEKFVGALIVPNDDTVREWAAETGIDLPDDRAAMYEDDRVHEFVRAEVDEVNERFESHERIKQFRLVPDEFTEENDLLTPTMKKKRRNILDRYGSLISDIYESTSQSTQSHE